MTKAKPAESGYMVQLDSLRAFAVFGVLLFHFYWGGKNAPFPIGGWGVRLFFVLSGFLITGILLDCRCGASDAATRRRCLTRFYARRALRIFPLFYLSLAVGALFNLPSVRETIWWHLTYASNFYFAQLGHWSSGSINCLWTLAVEEQFYVFWPTFILFIPQRLLLPFMVLAVLIAPTFKIAAAYFGMNSLAQILLMPACLDSLGVGAFLSLLRRMYPDRFQRIGTSAGFQYVGGVTALLLLIASTYVSPNGIRGSLFDTLAVLPFAWAVICASVGFGGVARSVMEFRPLVYCGRISYGLYIIHGLAPALLVILHVPIPHRNSLKFILYSVSTLILASLSWYLFEKPINSLKSAFPYTVNRKSND